MVDETVLRSLMLCLQRSAQHDTDIMSKRRSPSWCVRDLQCIEWIQQHA